MALNLRGLVFFVVLFYLIVSSISIYGKEADRSPCTIGIFSLPTSQQPGPLISFGQNVIDQNQLQLSLSGDGYLGRKQYSIDLVPNILYGITDNFSVFFNVPIAPSCRENKSYSSGFEDLFLQFEYAIYARDSACTSDQVTLVANVSFPTGSSSKTPSTGLGAVGYFVGTTYNRTWVDWFCFTSYGALLPMSSHGTQFGNQLLYEWGVGRDFADVKGWIFAWEVEIDGTFSFRDRVKGSVDPDSGGNLIYVTPSLWISSKDWIFQLGVGYAVQQHLFGNQERETYLISFNFGKTF